MKATSSQARTAEPTGENSAVDEAACAAPLLLLVMARDRQAHGQGRGLRGVAARRGCGTDLRVTRTIPPTGQGLRENDSLRRFVEAETSADIKRMVDVNLSSQIRLAHRLYIPLVRNGGRLCFIGSVAYKGSAAMPVYAATKAALDGLGRSLALEWQGRIVVKVLHPGPTATGMAESAGRKRDWLSRFMLPPSAMAEMIVRSIEDGGSFRQTLSYSRYLVTRYARSGLDASSGDGRRQRTWSCLGGEGTRGRRIGFRGGRGCEGSSAIAVTGNACDGRPRE